MHPFQLQLATAKNKVFFMKKLKKRHLLVGAAVLAAVVLFTFAKPASEDESLPFDVDKIKSDNANEQDNVTFSDGSTLTGIGFDLQVVGTIVLPQIKPVFLFKSFSCRECEPKVNLIVFNAETGEKHEFPFPGSHYLIGVEDGTPDTEDQIGEGVFGQCGGTDYKILLARKNREVESDGVAKRPSENWSFTSTTIEFSPYGKAKVTVDSQDTFTMLAPLISDTCLSLEPEDSHDYM